MDLTTLHSTIHLLEETLDRDKTIVGKTAALRNLAQTPGVKTQFLISNYQFKPGQLLEDKVSGCPHDMYAPILSCN